MGQRTSIARAGALSVYETFRATARMQPNALAVKAGERLVTFRELDARVCRIARVLAERGLQHGDRIALLSENRTEYLECVLAAAALGVIVACQNWRLTTTELAYCVELVTPKLAIVSPRHAGLLEASGAKVPAVLSFGEPFEALVRAASDTPLPREQTENVETEDGLLVIYTSGTTGMPKGALVSHRAEIARMTVQRMDLEVTGRDAFVAWAPMFHMGSADQMLAATMSGAPLIVVDGFDCRAIVDAIRDHQLGWLLLMPGSIEPVLEMVVREKIVPKGLKVVGAMPDLLPRQLVADLTAALNAPYLNSFGSTETGLPPASRSLMTPGVVPTSLSKLQSSLCDVRLVDPDGQEVPDGEAGEVAIRGPTIFSGYWNNESANAHDFVGGYFRMGDVFRKNPDGTFDFVDRAKYLIKSGGENIYPAEIERVLLTDKRITDAVVVRKKDDKWGEVPVAFVSVATAAEISAADVDALCRGALAGYKRPREIRFVGFDDFPRSTTGKIQRHEVEKKWL